jgi:hypothetical protein
VEGREREERISEGRDTYRQKEASTQLQRNRDRERKKKRKRKEINARER